MHFPESPSAPDVLGLSQSMPAPNGVHSNLQTGQQRLKLELPNGPADPSGSPSLQKPSAESHTPISRRSLFSRSTPSESGRVRSMPPGEDSFARWDSLLWP